MADYTTNLNLLKKNPETDGNDYFNIQTMLNDNWDKIDAGVAAKETPAGAQAKVDNLAGAGRTTHTVKGNADAITALNQIVTSHLAEDATTGQKGHIQLATNVEVTTGLNTTKAVTPAGAKIELDKKVAHSLATAVNDFLVASAAGIFVKKTLAEVKTILGLGSAAYTASADYATAAQGTLATNAIPKSTVTTANDFIVATGSAAVTRKSLADTRNLLEAPIVAVSANKTLALSDADTMQNCTNAAGITITIPPNSSVAFAVGTEIAIVRQGAGTIAIAPGSGVTLNSDGSKSSIKNQYMSAALKKTATDTWILVGSLSA